MADASEAEWSLLSPADEIREFAASTRQHLSTLNQPDAVRAALRGEAPSDHWDDLLEQGYLSVGMPEDADGLGTIVDLVTILEEVGRALVTAPVTTTAAAAQVLLRAGHDMSEDVSGPMGIAHGSTSDGPRFAAFDGATATTLLVVAEHPDGTAVSRLAVADAVRDPADQAIDPSRRTVEVVAGEELSRSVVPAGIDDVLAPARVCIAADLVGVAAVALDHAVAHALQRRQFGRAIGSFQAVKHAFADAYVGIERARSLTIGAAAEISAGGKDAAALALFAKAGAADAATRTTGLYIQLLGAMGLTFESDAHLYMRRARQTAPFLGAPSGCYARAAELRGAAAQR